MDHHYATMSLSIFAFHNLIHYLELNLKLILLTNSNSLYLISLCSFKKFNYSDYSGQVLFMRGGGAFSRLVYLC